MRADRFFGQQIDLATEHVDQFPFQPHEGQQSSRPSELDDQVHVAVRAGVATSKRPEQGDPPRAVRAANVNNPFQVKMFYVPPPRGVSSFRLIRIAAIPREVQPSQGAGAPLAPAPPLLIM